tara:strand:+ start:582 stop:782 length:201 start_codon:yes stop_codon:yes gene_type:complete
MSLFLDNAISSGKSLEIGVGYDDLRGRTGPAGCALIFRTFLAALSGGAFKLKKRDTDNHINLFKES